MNHLFSKLQAAGVAYDHGFGPYFTDTAHQLRGAGVGERTVQALDTYVYDDST